MGRKDRWDSESRGRWARWEIRDGKGGKVAGHRVGASSSRSGFRVQVQGLGFRAEWALPHRVTAQQWLIPLSLPSPPGTVCITVQGEVYRTFKGEVYRTVKREVYTIVKEGGLRNYSGGGSWSR